MLNRHAHGFDPRDLDAAGLRRWPDRPTSPPARREVGGGARSTRRCSAYIVDLVPRDPAVAVAVSSASPRAARPRCWHTARAWAWLSGRDYVTPDDVKALACPTLRHRVSLRPEAELEGVTADAVLESILATVPVPR